EGGFITQKDAMESTPDGGATKVFHDMNLWSIAAFYDAPLNKEKGTALSAYAGYFDYNFGPGYLRYNGIMNPANGIQPGYPAGSQGNAFPMFGTGQAIYTQVGYLMKQNLFGEGNGTLMPYASLMSAKWDRLDSRMNVWDIGVNWFVKGHTSKFTLDYQNRPYFFTNGNELVQSGYRGQWVLQYQIFF
ncbi:MAG TPA: hypothetical protein PLR06_14115, partial [Cyclobacteriaceae bacterium]|nr:hypothetical protein [Cyclobacteriaceae bacterium]